MRTIWLVLAGYVCGLMAGWSAGMVWTHPHWMPHSLNIILTVTAVIAMLGLGILSGRHDAERAPRPVEVMIKKTAFDRYVIVRATNSDQGWSGSRWVPVDGMGFPAGQFQVSNFQSREYATEIAEQAGFDVLD